MPRGFSDRHFERVPIAMNAKRAVFGRAHLVSFLTLYAVFAVLTFLALRLPEKNKATMPKALLVSVGAISGPFTGAMARDFQSCCWSNSLQLAPYCGGILGLSAMMQVVPLPFQTGQRVVRLALWVLGWLGWFGGVVVSFGHALS